MKAKKILYLTIGVVGLSLGILGAALPFIPVFPFILTAAYGFGKSSDHLSAWFQNTKLYQKNLDSFVKERRMTAKTKWRIILSVTLLMGFGFMMMKDVPLGQGVLVFIWICHIVYFGFVVKTIQ